MSNYLEEKPVAFPSVGDDYIRYGMTLRDYFAAKAMQGIIIRYGQEPPYLLISEDSDVDAADAETAKYAYEIADMMMQAREGEI